MTRKSNGKKDGCSNGAKSSAYVTFDVEGRPYSYHFTGVTSIEHNFALNIESSSSSSTDIVNGAKNLANQVTLQVVETDAEHASGWSARMLAAMEGLKKHRHLCKVVTSMFTYEKMMLTEITATQDEENQFGWTGELAFMEYIESTGEDDSKEKTNSSVRRNTGNTGAKKKVVVNGGYQSIIMMTQ